MIKNIHKKIRQAYEKRIDGVGMSIFRIFYSIILLADVIQIYYFRRLMFDEVPFLEPYELDFGPALILWMIVLLFMVIGLYTKQAVILNYVFTLVFISTINTYEYHMYYIYVSVNFLLMFLNLSQVNSLDRLRKKFKYSGSHFEYVPTRDISVLNYYMLVFVGIGFVYFNSVFYKLVSEIWLRGLGLWLPGSVLPAVYFDNSWLLNQEIIIKFLGYLTLIFETVFVFVFWFKRFRVICLAIGIALHVGILFFFPIPFFALGVCSIYMALVPVGFWKKIKTMFTSSESVVRIYYDEECPLCRRTKIFIKHFDFFNKIKFLAVQKHALQDHALANIPTTELLDNIYSVTKSGRVLKGIDSYIFMFKRLPLLFPFGFLISVPGIYHISKLVYRAIADNRMVERCTDQNCGYTPPMFPEESDNIKLTRSLRVGDAKAYGISFGILFLVLIQLIVTFNTPLIRNIAGPFNSTALFQRLFAVSKSVKNFSKVYMGITAHSVFVDAHFINYNDVFSVQYIAKDGSTYTLPITAENGLTGIYQLGPIWAKWGFRLNKPNWEKELFFKEIKAFLIFWAIKNDMSLTDGKFLVLRKKIEAQFKWEKDILSKQIATPWQEFSIIKFDRSNNLEIINYLDE